VYPRPLHLAPTPAPPPRAPRVPLPKANVLGGDRGAPPPASSGGDDLVGSAAAACGLSTHDAEIAVRAVLAALAATLARDEARRLAARLAEPWNIVVAGRVVERRAALTAPQVLQRLREELRCSAREAVDRTREIVSALEREVAGLGLVRVPPALRALFVGPAPRGTRLDACD
jgi:uncharacterized protein (DUF2267 family)